MELVQHDGPDRLQEGVVQELAGQDPLGHEAQPRRVGISPLESDLVADLIAQRPAALVGHASGRGPHGDPTRLEHDHDGMRRP